MSRTSGEGTKIAQAAKELNVTSVTIRRYLSEFNIETTTDENGVKVLPPAAMEELREIRRLKEEGLTNPRVLEILEENRAKQPAEKPRGRDKERPREAAARTRAAQPVGDEDEEEEEAEAAPARPPRRTQKGTPAKIEEEAEEEKPEEEAEEAPGAVADLAAAAARSKHSLTCQTCGKSFEHMNPRLRDCLDCYRTKRRERRRGSAERHKSVIQHPLAQQVASKSGQIAVAGPVVASAPAVAAAPVTKQQSTVRNYRKAIEETRQITSNLKRRLERPDLPEGERRWLEQIYAYQLILHQGWRHLAEYKSQTQQQSKPEG
ncbi:MAG TPA: helix-turn-helix domain-containing protein [Candidatus Obscuribacterales bacterium]